MSIPKLIFDGFYYNHVSILIDLSDNILMMASHISGIVDTILKTYRYLYPDKENLINNK